MHTQRHGLDPERRESLGCVTTSRRGKRQGKPNRSPLRPGSVRGNHDVMRSIY
ncbi:hypothetical protein F511_40898 [Dorcoceras hygrometricum]|uniref:Uncharacterized protein n=1 Tax=Dorcoceras hygrometricum TaxID=472368 RepID=A0A2Z7A6X4_9LAMI|nr:hypothetical protein F511_42173 [Dorcoceras hygrometricum]KZV33356.1 hypothetical protein F511_40898 [Dorcoceras hygrometricum]